MAIKFYVGTNCGLCEDAKIQIEFFKESYDHEIKIDTINIEEDDTLLEKYMLRIPVVEYDGQVLQEGNIDFITLTEAYNQMK
ncbi:glutaredoxin family protein [Mammaliicoccus sciuri]|uniref:glutaredoxin family protein n=1 Tax=Mammaliicoccus TaxID=2803850 RepID=UPI00099199D7|nr:MULTISPECIES: glutaredoxin family protein [Mammaliicoccus]OOV37028.1 thioredoxin family protein [Staphylococcus sp. MB371]PCQ21511.1 glutaredoxin family protein [Klebsiella pneumoniae]HCW35201.1 glutaredoxin family protein [Staphylococcus sp.]ARB41325.1 thioredoxin family protein [Mammaliicoccus sciuri]MBO3080242.1 glutaredoxin family protein [Mammaliicoccus sciuri]